MNFLSTRPFLESLEDRAVPAAVGPTPLAAPSPGVPAQAAPVQPGMTQPNVQGTANPVFPNGQATSTPGVTRTTSPTPLAEPSNGAVLSTPAQNGGPALLVVPNQQNAFSNTREPAPGTSPTAADAERVARANVEQGLRDAVGGSPLRRMMETQLTFSDDSLPEEALLPPR